MQQESQVIFGLDAGTTDVKNNILTVSPNGDLTIGEDFWRAHTTNTILVRKKRVRSWWDGELSQNLCKVVVDTAQIDGGGFTGFCNTGLSVVEKKTGEPLVVFYDKPTLVATLTPEIKRRKKIAHITEKADRHYIWNKALALQQNWSKIAELIGQKIDFTELGIESVGATYARMIMGIPFGEGIGFGPDEWKGVTGNRLATADDARQALKAFGYDESQFCVADSRFSETYNTYIAGDFPVLLEHISAAMEAGVLQKEMIPVETDSNFKIYTSADGPLATLDRFNAHGYAYTIVRNGAGVNNNIVRKYLLPKIDGEPDWYFRADTVAGEGYPSLLDNTNPYIYLPGDPRDDLGGLYQLDQEGKPVRISFDEIGYLEQEKSLVIAALYAGVIAALRQNLDLVKVETGRDHVVLHGGFIKKADQINKRYIISGMLGSEFKISLLRMPDPSALVGISAATHITHVNLDYRTHMHIEPFPEAQTLEAYYQKWLRTQEMILTS